MGVFRHRGTRSNRIRRIDDVLATLFRQKKGWRTGLALARLKQEWLAIVGKEIAAHAQPVHLARGRLDLSCDHDVWRAELQFLKPELLARISEVIGEGVVKEIWLK